MNGGRLFHPETIYGYTRSGEPITDMLVEQLASEAEEGYNVDAILRRRTTAYDREKKQAQEFADLINLADAFAQLYIMGVNGDICPPGDSNICLACERAWTKGREILDRIDPEWGKIA